MGECPCLRYASLSGVLNIKITSIDFFINVVFDASSKLPSGVLEGKLQWPGSMDECHAIVSPVSNVTGRPITGRHCTMGLDLPLPGITVSQ